MQKFFLPVQTDFFELFCKTAEELLIVAQQFQKLSEYLDSPDDFILAIEIHERQAFQCINTTLERLHKTFITPFDRYDIHRLIRKLANTIESIQRTSKRIVAYRLKVLPQNIHMIVSLCVQATEAIYNAVMHLNSLSNATLILASCDKINDLESKAEEYLLQGVSQLFEEPLGIRRLLKIKEIYEYAKSVLNRSQEVSNIIKDIVLEYS